MRLRPATPVAAFPHGRPRARDHMVGTEKYKHHADEQDGQRHGHQQLDDGEGRGWGRLMLDVTDPQLLAYLVMRRIAQGIVRPALARVAAPHGRERLRADGPVALSCHWM